MSLDRIRRNYLGHVLVGSTNRQINSSSNPSALPDFTSYLSFPWDPLSPSGSKILFILNRKINRKQYHILFYYISLFREIKYAFDNNMYNRGSLACVGGEKIE